MGTKSSLNSTPTNLVEFFPKLNLREAQLVFMTIGFFRTSFSQVERKTELRVNPGPLTPQLIAQLARP